MPTAKRIRCICGKIYDPSEHATGCPVCGVQVTVQSISIVGPGQPQGEQSASSAQSGSGAPAPPPLPPARKSMLWVWIGGAAVFLFLLMAGLVFAVYQILKPKQIVAVVTDGGAKDDAKKSNDSKESSGGGSSAQGGKTADNGNSGSSNSKGTGTGTQDAGGTKPDSGEKPKLPAIFKYDGKKWSVAARATPEESGKALMEVFDQAGEGDTLTLQGGAYVIEGLEIDRAMRIVGDNHGSPPVVIASTSTQRPPIRVTAKGVTLESLVIMQDGTKFPALHFAKESEVALVNCTATSKSNAVMNAQYASSITATDCGFGFPSGSGQSTIVTLLGKAEGETAGLNFKFIKCDFAGGHSGVMIVSGAKGEFNDCKFHEIGPPDGGGSVIKLTGGLVSATADQCQFYKNRNGILLTSGSLTVKGGSFSENGMSVDSQNKVVQPLGGVVGTATLSFHGVTFNSNRQGLIAMKGGSLEITDCQFNDQGFKTNDTNAQFFCNVLGAQGMLTQKKQRRIGDSESGNDAEGEAPGKPATMIVRGSEFSRPITRVAAVFDGAELTMENCKATGGGSDSITVGGSDAPCRASLKGCSISRFSQGGIAVSGGSFATLEDTELSQNDVGIEARDPGTQVQLNKVTFVGNNLLGIAAYDKAEVTARECTFQDNGYGGVQAGLPGKPDSSTNVNLVDCKLYNSRTMDVQACAKARITMNNSTFAPGAAPKVTREPTGIVEADPPVEIIASSGPRTQPQPQPGPKKQTAVNNKSAPRPQSSPQRTPPASVPKKVGEVIDVIDKVKRLIR